MTPTPRATELRAPLPPPPPASDVVQIEPFDRALDADAPEPHTDIHTGIHGDISNDIHAGIHAGIHGDRQPTDRGSGNGVDGRHRVEPLFDEPTGSEQPASAGADDRLASLLDADHTGVAVVSGDGRVLSANTVFLHTLGVRDIAELVPGSPGAAMLRSLLDHLPNEMLSGVGGTWHGDFDHHSLAQRNAQWPAEHEPDRQPDHEPDRQPDHEPDREPDRPGGQSTAVLGHGPRTLRATVVADPASGANPAGSSTLLSVLIHDVTAARRQLAELRHRATHDQLTGLSDRQHVLSHLANVINGQRGEAGHVAAIFVDVDQLKYVNDAFGHRAGDRLIAATAERLARAVRPTDRVARIGGDEFLVVGPNVANPTVGLALAERIRRALTGRLKIGDLDLEYSVSIGVALTDDELLELPDHDAASTLVSHADSAMYAAKHAGRGRSIIYTPRMRSDARARAEVASRLARAVADDVLTVEYQPVYSTVTGRAVAAEALVRWHHPHLGEMDPATFISIAEESGVIGRLGEQVLGRALDDLMLWRESGRVGTDFAVHVNVSRAQLSSAGFVPTVLTMLNDRGIAPTQLVLEARETSLVGRAADVDRTIRSFRRAGVQVAVDNFGTGPKALAVMTDVGADMLKLDGSLALPTGSTDTDTRLVRAIALLAHALGMSVVAERVTSSDQLARLRAAGCDLVQGHLLSEATAVELLDLESPAW